MCSMTRLHLPSVLLPARHMHFLSAALLAFLEASSSSRSKDKNRAQLELYAMATPGKDLSAAGRYRGIELPLSLKCKQP